MPPFQEWLVQLTSMLSNILLGVAAIIGIIGLWQWRTELIGRTKFEVARKMTLLALQFRDEFHRTRNIFTLAGESVERKRSNDESPAVSQTLDEYYARTKRLQPLQETLRKLYEASWEAEVILSEEDAKLIQPFEESFRQLFIATEFFFRARLDLAKSGSDNIGIDPTQHDEMHRTIYGLSDDSIGKPIDSAVDVLKIRLKKYVR